MKVWLAVHVDGPTQQVTPFKFIEPFDRDNYDAWIEFFETWPDDTLYVFIYDTETGFDQWACGRPELEDE